MPHAGTGEAHSSLHLHGCGGALRAWRVPRRKDDLRESVPEGPPQLKEPGRTADLWMMGQMPVMHAEQDNMAAAPASEGTDLSRAFTEDGQRKTHVGGQALIEGIMMRGKYNWAVAVREPDGNIYLEEHDLASGKEKHRWMKLPFIRGCTALVESLALGFKALEIAAEHAFGDEEDEARTEAQAIVLDDRLEDEFASAPADATDTDAPSSDDGLGKGVMTFSMVMGVVLGVVLFIVAPAAITNLIVGEYDQNVVAWNVVDGILRVAIFIFYIWLIGRMEDIKRMFMYHGAEHKAIHCFEHGLPMTPENARQFPRLHVRCGTAFLIMVMVIAILVYTIFPLNAIIAGFGVPDGLPKLLLVIVARIVLMPVIAGISYEITVKWAGSHPDNPLVKVILWPGMQMQYLTTHEPDDAQMECAIAAMQAVLAREDAEAARATGAAEAITAS